MNGASRIKRYSLVVLLLAQATAYRPSSAATAHPVAQQHQDQALLQVATIPLDGVEGRIDHFGVDLEGERLFVSALGNNTVEVLDLRANRRLGTISGLHEPQGVLFVPEFHKVYVANAHGGTVMIFDGATFKSRGEVPYSDDADNVRYDPQARRVYVGYGDGALGAIDAATGQRLPGVKLEAHPESFQLETSGPRIFVNVPDAGHIAVIDRVKQAVVARWPVKRGRANFPMALDEADRRLFVTCRRPPELLVLDTTSGKAIATFPVVGDADDMFYDAARKSTYITGGEGAISIVQQQDADHYQVIGRVATAAGARTSFFVPSLSRLYVAVPHRGRQRAEIRVYQAQGAQPVRNRVGRSASE